SARTGRFCMASFFEPAVRDVYRAMSASRARCWSGESLRSAPREIGLNGPCCDLISEAGGGTPIAAGVEGGGGGGGRAGLAAQHFEHLTRQFLLLLQDFFQHRLLRICNHVFRRGRRGWLLSERFWRQLVVQVGCDSLEGAQFLHQLTETDRDTELSFQQE